MRLNIRLTIGGSLHELTLCVRVKQGLLSPESVLAREQGHLEASAFAKAGHRDELLACRIRADDELRVRRGCCRA